MSREAPSAYPVHELVRRRWSPRAFADRPVPIEALRTVLEAARWAPSCFNEQPWRFVVATRDDPEGFGRLVDCLSPGNQRWAPHAPVLMLTVARLDFEDDGKPNRHALHDVGLAMGQAGLQATSLGLVMHQMAGFDRDKARERLAIPEGYEPVAAVALGYLGNAEDLPENLRERERAPRTRHPQEAFVFGGRWDAPFSEAPAHRERA